MNLQDFEPCPLDELVACEVCGALNPLPEPVLIVQGDYDAPPVYGYEEDWTTCCKCGQRAVRLQ